MHEAYALVQFGAIHTWDSDLVGGTNLGIGCNMPAILRLKDRLIADKDIFLLAGGIPACQDERRPTEANITRLLAYRTNGTMQWLSIALENVINSMAALVR